MITLAGCAIGGFCDDICGIITIIVIAIIVVALIGFGIYKLIKRKK